MRERPDRSYWGFWASFIQSLLAAVVLVAFCWALFFLGTLRSGPFDIETAVQVGERLLLPVAAIVIAAVLLWLRTKWGWFLTLLINALMGLLTGYLLFHDLLLPHNHSYPNLVWRLASLQILLWLPVILLLVPETRRDFLKYRASPPLIEVTSNSQQF
jgi:hypothetical protein